MREIHRELRPAEDELAYTTVLSLMQTMEKKGLVGREPEGKGKKHWYFAKVRAERTLRKLAGTFLDTVFDGAMGNYLVRALESREPTIEELDELEEMIAEARRRVRGEEDGDE